ncbi:MAG TPA: thiolase family protein [Deltaproteobacteria bacterium]|nr:thiolase family protein [Deltaproteobacteria bacterium]
MHECVIVDAVRTANTRAHQEKGWFAKARPDDLLTTVYKAIFTRNTAVSPEDIDAVFCGCANLSGMHNDIARLAWLASGFPETVATNGIAQQCPSGMAAVEHAARAIMSSEGDVFVASGVEDMLHVPLAYDYEPPPRLMWRYPMHEMPMEATAEKIAAHYNISREDAENVAYWSHKRAARARDEGKFADEIVPMKGFEEDGREFMVERDQWIRDDISFEQMSAMKPLLRENGVVTAAVSSPNTTGACALLLMNRQKADELNLGYHLKYVCGVMAGCDPTMMGIGPVHAVRKLLHRTGLNIGDIGVWEINEAFGAQVLACVRELGLGENAPFDNINIRGGALALGHPLGESGARIIVTLNSIMKTDRKDAKYSVATLCGAFGNAAATLWERVEK